MALQGSPEIQWSHRFGHSSSLWATWEQPYGPSQKRLSRTSFFAVTASIAFFLSGAVFAIRQNYVTVIRDNEVSAFGHLIESQANSNAAFASRIEACFDLVVAESARGAAGFFSDAGLLAFVAAGGFALTWLGSFAVDVWLSERDENESIKELDARFSALGGLASVGRGLRLFMGVACVVIMLFAVTSLLSWGTGYTVGLVDGISDRVGVFAARELGRWPFVQAEIDKLPGLEAAAESSPSPLYAEGSSQSECHRWAGSAAPGASAGASQLTTGLTVVSWRPNQRHSES